MVDQVSLWYILTLIPDTSFKNDEPSHAEILTLEWITRLIYSAIMFIAGWLFNFVFDIQFALGVAAGWLMREGFANTGRVLLELIK